jgi:hypothetical protein
VPSPTGTEEDVVSHRNQAPGRGVAGRNAKLKELRRLVSRDRAVLAVDLAAGRQAAVVLDHDSVLLARRMFTGSAWCISQILAWAEPIAATAGFARLVLACEPAGHRRKPLVVTARPAGIPVVCVPPLLVRRAREGEAIHAAAARPGGIAAGRDAALERAGFAGQDWMTALAAIAGVEARMVAVPGELHLTRLAATIPGLSAVSAAAILAETGDPHHYDSPRTWVKHAGLAPRANESGNFRGLAPACAPPPGGRSGARCRTTPSGAPGMTS